MEVGGEWRVAHTHGFHPGDLGLAPQVETELILATANQRNVDAILNALSIFSTLKSSFQNDF